MKFWHDSLKFPLVVKVMSINLVKSVDSLSVVNELTESFSKTLNLYHFDFDRISNMKFQVKKFFI